MDHSQTDTIPMNKYMRYVLKFAHPVEGVQIFSSPVFIEGDSNSEQCARQWLWDHARSKGYTYKELLGSRTVEIKPEPVDSEKREAITLLIKTLAAPAFEAWVKDPVADEICSEPGGGDSRWIRSRMKIAYIAGFSAAWAQAHAQNPQ